MKNENNFVLIFKEEARDLLKKIQHAYKNWNSSKTDKELLSEILRDLHTLKGSARMVGLMNLNELVQSLEQFFRGIYEEKQKPTSGVLEKIQTTLDYLNAYIEDKNLGAVENEPHENLIEHVRIEPEKLEKMSSFISEINLSNRRIDQNIKKLIDESKETIRNIILLREQAKQLLIKTDASIKYHDSSVAVKKYEEFDFLEMDTYSYFNQKAREISEKSAKIESKIESSMDALRRADFDFVEQKRAIKILEESIRHSRLISVREVIPRLERIVRQVSHELFKDVRLVFLKIEGEIDRKILEQLIPPLEHMIRNAIDHGIEAPADRILAGKKEYGTLSISFYKRGNEMIIDVIDDGKGIDFEAVKKRAIQKKIWNKEKSMSEAEAIRTILLPGFTTREFVTPISGQGVGLDVVNTEVNKLGGVLTIISRPGEGSTFTIHVPLSLSRNKVLIFTLKDSYYGLPLSHLVAVKKYKISELECQAQKKEFVFLENLLNFYKKPESEKREEERSVIFLKSEYKEIAIVVDQLIGSWEVLVKPLSFQLQKIKEISGVSFLGDEKIVFMLDSLRLIQNVSKIKKGEKIIKEKVERKVPVVLIVDDSNTVRRVTARMLRKNGFEWSEARDGQEALLHMLEHQPDIVLLDLEMPEMDGFEVLEKIRANNALKDTPVIVITSRAGDKHRIRAEKIGISGYFTKPYLEEDLLALIREILHVQSNKN